MILGYPFIIYQLCKKAWVPISTKEDLLHLLKVIIVRKKKGDPILQSPGIIDSGNESISDENEENEDDKDLTPPSTQVPMTRDEGTSSSNIHDQIEELIGLILG